MIKRCWMAFIGVIVIGFSVTLLNLSSFGTDPYTCMNMAVSEHLLISFGVWQLYMNLVIFSALLIYMKKEKKQLKNILGFGMIWNMTGVGLLVDFFTNTFHAYFGDVEGLLYRILFLLAAIVGLCLGCSLYMTPALGSAPYDSVALQIHEKSKVAFKICRITTDSICVIIALIFGGNIGIGTLITALGTGPLIQFFNGHVSEPCLNHKRRGEYEARRINESI